jgi:hypothetical protein
MMSNPYVDGITDKVSHNFASSLTADQIPADEDRVTISLVCPDRWFLGDFAVLTSRDGGAFAGEVESMDVCTGEVTIRGVGQLVARVASLSGLPRWVPHRQRPEGAVLPSEGVAPLVEAEPSPLLDGQRVTGTVNRRVT